MKILYPVLLNAIQITGSQKKLADILGIPASNVSQWTNLRKDVPEKHIEAIYSIINNARPNEEQIHPDVPEPDPISQIEELFLIAKKHDLPIVINVELGEHAPDQKNTVGDNVFPLRQR